MVLHPIECGNFKLDGGAMFGVVPKVIWQKTNPADKNNLVKVKEDQFIEEFLPQVVCTNANCEVIDKSGKVKGYITNKELQKTLTKS